MTSQQKKQVEEFEKALQSQINDYTTWGSQRCLNVIYFDFEGIVFLKAIVPAGISNDDAGMFVDRHYFKIMPDGELKNIRDNVFLEKMEQVSDVISCNKNV